MGQVEGAFTMGLGYWLTEKLIYDQDSGELLTHNTWVSSNMCTCNDDFRPLNCRNTSHPLRKISLLISGLLC